ncbi:hypothetical protein TWF481_007367 [Arthrobotrys musiformis]|uniref:Uncharacterized protein n=1 Tax=Arthrobotrys musiformis TaxID=47236 RepID=A0AAV9WDA6_9PEZI
MNEDADLAKRFESIFSKKPIANSGWDKSAVLGDTAGANHRDADISWQATDEASLEDLLEELGAEDTSWIEEAKSLSIEGKKAGKLDTEDSSAVQKLLAEAKERLKAQDQEDESHEKGLQTFEAPAGKASDHEEVEDKANSDDEADEILRQIQDSLSLGDTLEEKEEKSKSKSQILPQDDDDDDADDELAKRFAALDKLNLPPPPKDIPSASNSLNLPGVPTSQPGVKGKKTMTQKVDDLMDDIENWCCICNEDAVVKCLGCDGDLYCTECFNEGHRGNDAPYDMKRHKALAYNKKGPMAA